MPLGDFLVVAMEVAEDRLELDDAFAVEHDVHAEDAVRGRMLRPHGDFEQFGFAVRLHDRAGDSSLRSFARSVEVLDGVVIGRRLSVRPALCCGLCAAARSSTSSCGVGSYS